MVASHIQDVLLRSKDGAAKRRGLVCSVVDCEQENSEILVSTSVDGVRVQKQTSFGGTDTYSSYVGDPCMHTYIRIEQACSHKKQNTRKLPSLTEP